MSEAIPNWRASGLRYWPLAVAALLLDQLTKEVIQRTLDLYETIYVLPVLEIIHARNTGAAFSFLANAGGWQRWAFTGFALVVSVFIVFTLRRTSAALQRLPAIGLMLIASGAIGNAIDRLRHGYVVDFVNAHWGDAYFPAFNVADSCITIGAGLVLLDALLEWRRGRRVEHGQVK